MIPYDEDHIEPPSAISDSGLKKEYGRELAFSSLIKGCYSAAKNQQHPASKTATQPGDIPDLKTAEKTVGRKIISFPALNNKLSRRVLLALAASIAAITAPLWLTGNQPRPSDQNPQLVLTVDSLKGDVTVIRAGSEDPLIPAPGDLIHSGDRIITGMKSRTRLLYPDGTSIQVRSFTDLLNRINPDNLKAKSLHLQSGRLTVNAQKQPTDARLTIVTPSAIAEVLGTIFIIKATETHTELIVNEGIVDLIRTSAPEGIKVEAGHVAHVTPELEKLEVVKPEITSFSLIDIHSGKPLPGYEEIMGDTLISYSELPKTGVGIRANISGLTDMVEIQRPDHKNFLKKPDSPFETEDPDFIGYKAIDSSINPFPVTATPYSRQEGSGEPQQVRLFFSDE